MDRFFSVLSQSTIKCSAVIMCWNLDSFADELLNLSSLVKKLLDLAKRKAFYALPRRGISVLFTVVMLVICSRDGS